MSHVDVSVVDPGGDIAVTVVPDVPYTVTVEDTTGGVTVTPVGVDAVNVDVTDMAPVVVTVEDTSGAALPVEPSTAVTVTSDGMMTVTVTDTGSAVSVELSNVGATGPQGPPAPGAANTIGLELISDVVEMDYLAIDIESNILNSADPAFTSDSVGKTIIVRNAGNQYGPLIATITAVNSPTQAVLSADAEVTRDGTTGYYGTDNAAAITTVTGSMPAGTTLQFPVGNYLTTYLPEWQSDNTWAGHGAASTIYWAGLGNAIEGVNVNNAILRDFRLVGPHMGLFNPVTLGDPTYRQTADGVHVEKTGVDADTAANKYLTISNLTIERFSRDAISLDTPIVSRIEKVTIHRMGMNGVHLYGTGENAGTSTHLDSVYAGGCYEAGYLLQQMAYTTLTSCAADANGVGYLYVSCPGITENSSGSEEPYDFYTLGYTANVEARGYGRRVINTKLTQNAPYLANCIGTSEFISNASVVAISAFYEGTPWVGAAASLKVAAGCSVTVSEYSIITPMDLTPGTTKFAGSGTGTGATVATVTVTTASLANGALETVTADLGAVFTILRVETSGPARVRAYASTADAAVDEARPIGYIPTGDHGLILDYVTTASVLSAALSPVASGQAAVPGATPIIVTNNGATGPVTITFTALIEVND